MCSQAPFISEKYGVLAPAPEMGIILSPQLSTCFVAAISHCCATSVSWIFEDLYLQLLGSCWVFSITFKTAVESVGSVMSEHELTELCIHHCLLCIKRVRVFVSVYSIMDI